MRTEGITDAALIDLLRAPGQQEQDDGMRWMYRQYYAMIEQLVLKNSGSAEDAADIFQDGVVVFFRKVRQPDFNLTSAASTFLYAICRNLWLMRLRKQHRETELTEVHTETVPVESGVMDYLEESEQSRWIDQILMKLKDDCRKVLIYFYFDRLRMAEIMELMNYQSAQVAKNKKARCMQKLRELAAASPQAKELFD